MTRHFRTLVSDLRLMTVSLLATVAGGCRIGMTNAPEPAASADFIRVVGKGLVDGSGNPFRIRGVNLGHWLNPEGYMFGFTTCNSPHAIDRAFRELVGDEATDAFWRKFKANYVTEADIAWIAATGANTVRVPFNYRSFSHEDYMGLRLNQDGFARLDAVVAWCARHGLRVVLDMHACPGGQTGDNIDDSHGYPWLFESEAAKRQYCEIWRRIARHFAAEPTVLGYDLMNEPISDRLQEKDELNRQLKRLQTAAARAIRDVDSRHVLIFSGAQWNTNFTPFGNGFRFDANSMFTCHHYDFSGHSPDFAELKAKIRSFAAVRDRLGAPMYMGETGHNDATWYRTAVETMAACDIGWTFWPYKKPGVGGWMGFSYPEGWDLVRRFAEADRRSYSQIQAMRPDRKLVRRILEAYAERCRFGNCRPDEDYLGALGLRAPN